MVPSGYPRTRRVQWRGGSGWQKGTQPRLAATYPGTNARTHERPLIRSGRFAHRKIEATTGWPSGPFLESRVDRLALERQYPKDALMDPAQGLASRESLHRLDPERELAMR